MSKFEKLCNEYRENKRLIEELTAMNDELKAAILENYGFWYFHVTLKSGYYEGFYIDIENNFPCFFDNWEEKRYAQKEVTQIRRFLMDCTAAGLVQYSPGWCTGYSTEKETRAAINAAIKEMRREVQETPTYRQYNAA